MTIILLDGYTDEPSNFGVPPYISFTVRYVYGAIKDLKKDCLYLTIDQFRQLKESSPFHKQLLNCNLMIIIAGCIVPGKYLRGTPITVDEIKTILIKYHPRMAIFGGAGAKFGFGGIGGEKIVLSKLIKPFFDLVAKQDIDATVYDYLTEGVLHSRKRTYDEWIKWSKLGTELVIQHPDYPSPLLVELEISKGCPRYINGGCNFCIEPLFGKPINKEPEDLVEEVELLYRFGVRNFRIGGTTDVYSYLASGIGFQENPIPNVNAWKRLFNGISTVAPQLEVLHLDNANPAVIAQFPNESRAITKLFVEFCTSGNILPFGLESADTEVQRQNNLNTTSEETMFAIRLINELGHNRGPNGLPILLPGLNFISGLLGETKKTFKLNYEFLKQIYNEGLLLRRINLRQVTGLQQNFQPDKYKDLFHWYKKKVREEIDKPMLRRLLPLGTVLRNVFLEQIDKNFIHGRQIGTYALLISLPKYFDRINIFQDVIVTGYGHRSISGLPIPISINKLSRNLLELIPGIGKKRARTILLQRPLNSSKDIEKIIDDKKIMENLKPVLDFKQDVY